MIVISSPVLVSELLDKRHSGYENRPNLTMACDLVGWNRITPLMPANKLWREHRRNMSQLFGTKAAVGKFYEIEVLQARKLMRRILEDPAEVKDHIRRYAAHADDLEQRRCDVFCSWAGTLSMKIAYGYDVKRVKGGQDPYLAIAHKVVSQFLHLHQPGAFMVDSLPWLQYIPAWFPGAAFQRTAKSYRDMLSNLIDTPFRMVQKQLASVLRCLG